MFGTQEGKTGESPALSRNGNLVMMTGKPECLPLT
jgi:hypothetical protein